MKVARTSGIEEDMMRTSAFVTLMAAMLAACAQTDQLSPATETPIEVGGGTAFSPDGALTLTFGPGDLDQRTVVRIEESRELMGWSRLTPSYTVLLRGAVLRAPVSVRLSFNAPYDAATERAFLADVSGGVPVEVPGATLDTNAAQAELDGLLRTYAVVRRSIACEGLACGDGCGEGTMCDPHGACVSVAFAASCAPPDAGVRPDGAYGNQGRCEADGGFPFQSSRVTPCGIHEVEPNDSPASAQLAVHGVDQGVDVTGYFDGNDDYYLFTIPEGTYGSILAVTFTEIDNYSSCTHGLSLGVALADAQGNVLQSNDTGRCSAINYYVENNAAGLWPGDFTLRVFGPAPPSGNELYHLAIYVLGPANAPATADGGIVARDSGF